MIGHDDLPDDFRGLVDAYCSNLIGDDELRRLEAILLDSEAARREFVAYFQMHTDIQFTVRARSAAGAVLDRVAQTNGQPSASRQPSWPKAARQVLHRVKRKAWWSAVAAAVLIAGIGFLIGRHGRGPREPLAADGSTPANTSAGNVAWLVNAQDCVWTGEENDMPGRDMRAGKILNLRRGLAEIEFDRGARVILQGPARLALLDGNSARLLEGTLTARVPFPARGFTVLSPRGKVVDLGTEFGLSVDKQGDTAVHVFDGKVEASALAATSGEVPGIMLLEDQAARIDGRVVAMQPAGETKTQAQFVRAIVPPPIIEPRRRMLDFSRDIFATLQDAEGQGIGLTHRLPSTGDLLPERDANLRLNLTRGVLELTTTRSDINQQVGMPEGEYLGFRLSDLGFTGREDFAISATIPDIPSLEVVGQFGLYAGTRSDRNIRGGLISMKVPDSYGLFLVNNDGGQDSDLYEVGLMRTGDDLRLTLRRMGGRYSLIVENLTAESSSTLAIAHPAFLDGEAELYVGVFGANTQSNLRRTLTIKAMSVTVWTVTPGREVHPSPRQVTLSPGGSEQPSPAMPGAPRAASP